MWDLSFLTREQTCTPSDGRLSLNRWTSREVPVLCFFKFSSSELPSGLIKFSLAVFVYLFGSCLYTYVLFLLFQVSFAA